MREKKGESQSMSPTVTQRSPLGRVPFPSLQFSVSAMQWRAESEVKAWGARLLYTRGGGETETGRGREGEGEGDRKKDAMPSHDLLFSSNLTWLPWKPGGKEAEGGVRLNQ